MRKRDVLIRLKPFINLSIYITKMLPRRIRLTLLNFFQNFSGTFAIGIRYILLKTLLKSCGDNVSVHKNVVLLGLDNLEIGDNVSIHPFCYIDGTGGLVIGKDVSIAHSSTILTTEHLYSDLNIPIKDQGIKNIPTVLKDDIWIACGVRILAGSHISNGTIIAAGAVVKGYIKPNSIYGGIPAKFLKDR